MNNAFFYIILFPIMVALQVLVFNHLVLFGVAVGFLFIYFILKLPIGLSTNWTLTLSFLLGAVVDILSDTPGVNALSCTILAICKRPALFAYIPHDDKTKSLVPSIDSLGWQVFSKYAITMSAIYSLFAFSIEFFNFSSVSYVLLMSASSALLTFFLMYASDAILSLFRHKK